MDNPISGPAYRAITQRLLIRCWQPQDAPMLKEAIDASIDHLQPWMPWAMEEPTSLDTKIQRLRRFRGDFDLGNDFIYAIFDPGESKVIGGSGLHLRRGENAREIGYWIREDQINRGLATETAAALTRVAFEVDGVDRVEIHCGPNNVRSAAVPKKLGYQHEATLKRRMVDSDGELRDTMIWSLFAGDYPKSPSASSQIEAYDAAGRRIL